MCQRKSLINKGGSAFLIYPERKNEDYFIPSSKISSAYDGDYVLCQISKEKEAKVIYIIQRGSKKIAELVVRDWRIEQGQVIPVMAEYRELDDNQSPMAVYQLSNITLRPRGEELPEPPALSRKTLIMNHRDGGPITTISTTWPVPSKL